MKTRKTTLIAIKSQAAYFQDREDIYLAALGAIIFAEIIAQYLIKL